MRNPNEANTVSTCALLVQVVALESGDKVMQVMQVPNMPGADASVVLVTTAGFMAQLSVKSLTDKIGQADSMKPFKCMKLQVMTACHKVPAVTVTAKLALVAPV